MRASLQRIATVSVLAAAVCLASTLTAQGPVQPSKAAAQQESAAPSAEDKRKALEADVERLVKLASQLRADVEHARADELSVKVLRGADEIDRLARSTRTRIR